VIGIHVIGRSPSLLSTIMDFCRELRCDADGSTCLRGGGRDPARVINEVRSRCDTGDRLLSRANAKPRVHHPPTRGNLRGRET
jgi:hypothetical protein